MKEKNRIKKTIQKEITKVKISQSDKKKEIKKEEVKEKKVKKNELAIPLFNNSGEEESKITLPEKIFSIKVNEKLLAQYVYIYLANQRQKTASTKTRGEVTGSTRKIYRQKGTGRARHGDIKAPIFVGGGVVGGPKPYKKTLKISKKQKKKALFSALTLKARNKDIIAFSSEILNIQPKTKKAVEILKKINFLDKKILFVLPKLEKNSFILAFRNLPKIDFTDAKSLNPYIILKNEKIVFLEPTINILEEHFLKVKKTNN